MATNPGLPPGVKFLPQGMTPPPGVKFLPHPAQAVHAPGLLTPPAPPEGGGAPGASQGHPAPLPNPAGGQLLPHELLPHPAGGQLLPHELLPHPVATPPPNPAVSTAADTADYKARVAYTPVQAARVKRALAGTYQGNDVQALAVRIVHNKNITPAFGRLLARYAAADPTFEARLNAEVTHRGALVENYINRGALSKAGEILSSATDPFDAAAAAIYAPGQLAHHQYLAGSLGLLGVVPFGRAARIAGAISHLAAEGIHVDNAVRAEMTVARDLGGANLPHGVETEAHMKDVVTRMNDQLEKGLPHATDFVPNKTTNRAVSHAYGVDAWAKATEPQQQAMNRVVIHLAHLHNITPEQARAAIAHGSELPEVRAAAEAASAPAREAKAARDKVIEGAAEATRAVKAEPNGGATLHGDMTPDTAPGHVVGTAIHNERVPVDLMTTGHTLDYADRKAPGLAPDERVGLWHNGGTSQAELDISKVFPLEAQAEAARFAREQGQMSYMTRLPNGEKVFHDTGLTQPEADAIQARLKAEAGVPVHPVEHVAPETTGEIPKSLSPGGLNRLLGARRVVDPVTRDRIIAEANRRALDRGAAPEAADHLTKALEGVTPQAYNGDAQAWMHDMMNSSPAMQTEIARLHSIERGVRAGRAEEAMRGAPDELSAQAAALNALKGTFPTVRFQGHDTLNPQSFHAMLGMISDHPALPYYEGLRARGALIGIVHSGIVPTKSELTSLRKVFGASTTTDLVKSIPFWKRAGQTLLEAMNIPRALMASFDVSAPFRQGLMTATYSPTIFARNLVPMLKVMASQPGYDAMMSGIVQRDTYALSREAGVQYTVVGGLNKGEEALQSSLAERPFGRFNPVLASDRAYTGFLNKMRSDLFDRLVRQAVEEGVDVTGEAGLRELKSIGAFVNAATGRGNLPKFLESHAATLNAMFFSPRLMASRLHFLATPLLYARMTPFERRQSIIALVRLTGTAVTIGGALKLAGANISLDPSSADFLKIRIGNTRIDLLGGYQPYLRLIGQLSSDRYTSTTTGLSEPLSLRGGGHGTKAVQSLLTSFFRGKLAPTPSVIADYATRKESNFQNPWSLKGAEQELLSHVTPLLAQDMESAIKSGQWQQALLGTVGSAIGFGVNTYGPAASGGGGGGGGSTGYGGGGTGYEGYGTGYGGGGSTGYEGYGTGYGGGGSTGYEGYTGAP